MKKAAAAMITCSALGACALAGCASRAIIVARPGPPVAGIVVAPGPRAVWVPGHWVYRPYWGRYVWVRGYWR